MDNVKVKSDPRKETNTNCYAKGKHSAKNASKKELINRNMKGDHEKQGMGATGK